MRRSGVPVHASNLLPGAESPSHPPINNFTTGTRRLRYGAHICRGACRYPASQKSGQGGCISTLTSAEVLADSQLPRA